MEYIIKNARFFFFLMIYYMVVGDYKEGYYIGVEVPEDDPKAEKPFYGPNVWPSDGINFFLFCF
jgi:hypothetical protein